MGEWRVDDKRRGVSVAGCRGANEGGHNMSITNKCRTTCQTYNSAYRGNGAWSCGEEDSHDGGDEEELLI